MNNKKGFTLAELLIVVAIIAILTAVAVPIFNSQLEKSKEETDIANLRSAKAAAIAYFMDEDTSGTTVKFDATSGKIVASSVTVVGYGKGTEADGKCEDFKLSTKASDTTKYESTDNVKDRWIEITMEIDSTTHEKEYTMAWVAASTTP